MKEKALARETRGQKRVFIVSTCPTYRGKSVCPFPLPLSDVGAGECKETWVLGSIFAALAGENVP